MKKPNFFIVGAPKCGTHAMYTFLKAHPEIFMPERKEFQYFATDLVKGTQYELTEEKYLSYFQMAKDEKRLGEASTWYLYSKKAASNIKKFSPHAKIIIMLRHPIEMMYSYWLHNLYYGHENVPDFTRAVELEECRKSGKQIPANLRIPVELLYYKEIAKFAEQVERYLKIFGRDNVRIILQEELKRNPYSCYRNVLEFLEVNPNFVPKFGTIYPRKKPRSLFLNNLLNHPPFVLNASKKFIPKPMRRKIGWVIRRLNTEVNPKDEIPRGFKSKLLKEFRGDIEKLMELTGIDLSHWISSV